MDYFLADLGYTPNSKLLGQYRDEISSGNFLEVLSTGNELAKEIKPTLDTFWKKFSNCAYLAVDYTAGLVFAGSSKEDLIMQVERFGKQVEGTIIDDIFAREDI
jgi:hypothetical protein